MARMLPETVDILQIYPARLSCIYYPPSEHYTEGVELYFYKVREAYWFMSLVDATKENYLQAKKLLDEAIKLNPDNGLAYLYLAQLYEQNKIPLSESEFKRQIEDNPELNTEQIASARKDYIRQLQAKAMSVEFSCDSASFERDKKRAQAFYCCDLAIGTFTAKSSYTCPSHFRRAFSYIQKALILDPDYAEAHFLMGLIYLKGYMGHVNLIKARECFIRASELGLVIAHEYHAQVIERMSLGMLQINQEDKLQLIKVTLSKATPAKCLPAELHLLKYHPQQTQCIALYKQRVDEMEVRFQEYETLRTEQPGFDSQLSEELHKFRLQRLRISSIEAGYACLQLIEYYHQITPTITLFSSTSDKNKAMLCRGEIEKYFNILLRIMNLSTSLDFFRHDFALLLHTMRKIYDPNVRLMEKSIGLKWDRSFLAEHGDKAYSYCVALARNGDIEAKTMLALSGPFFVVRAYFIAQVAEYRGHCTAENIAQFNQFFSQDFSNLYRVERLTISYYRIIFSANLTYSRLELFQLELNRVETALRVDPRNESLLRQQELIQQRIVHQQNELQSIFSDIRIFYESNCNIMVMLCMFADNDLQWENLITLYNNQKRFLPVFIDKIRRTAPNTIIESKEIFYLQQMLILDDTQSEHLNQLRVELALYYIRSGNALRAIPLLAQVYDVSFLTPQQCFEIAMFYQMCAIDLIHQVDADYSGELAFDLMPGMVIESQGKPFDVVYCLRRSLSFHHSDISQDDLVRLVSAHYLTYPAERAQPSRSEVVMMVQRLQGYRMQEVIFRSPSPDKSETGVASLDEAERKIEADKEEAVDAELSLMVGRESSLVGVSDPCLFTFSLIRDATIRQEIIAALVEKNDSRQLALIFFYYPEDVLAHLFQSDSTFARQYFTTDELAIPSVVDSLVQVVETEFEQTSPLATYRYALRQKCAESVESVTTVSLDHQSRIPNPLVLVLANLDKDDNWLLQPSPGQVVLLNICRINCHHIPEANFIFARYTLKFIAANPQRENMQKAFSFINQLYFHNLTPEMHLSLAHYFYDLIAMRYVDLLPLLFADDYNRLREAQPPLSHEAINDALYGILFERVRFHLSKAKTLQETPQFKKVQTLMISHYMRVEPDNVTLQKCLLLANDDAIIFTESIEISGKVMLNEIMAIEKGERNHQQLRELLHFLGVQDVETLANEDLAPKAISLLQDKVFIILNHRDFRESRTLHLLLYKVHKETILLYILNKVIAEHRQHPELEYSLATLRDHYPNDSPFKLLHRYCALRGRSYIIRDDRDPHIFRLAYLLEQLAIDEICPEHAAFMAEDALSYFKIALDQLSRASVLRYIKFGCEYFFNKYQTAPDSGIFEQFRGLKSHQLPLMEAVEITIYFLQFRDHEDIMQAVLNGCLIPNNLSFHSPQENFDHIFVKPFLQDTFQRLSQDSDEVKAFKERDRDGAYTTRIQDLHSQLFPPHESDKRFNLT